ncbi:hypothetical protein BY457_1221, partial [Marinilabilia salmonicolor]|uniref:hypothetical protein n=1 Tax=Marinilabilia salmonicolor TaxID=989 RepID=UPI000D4E5821
MTNMAACNKAIYASRGIHSILKVLYFPKPFFQADKSIAGLKPRPGAYSRDVSAHSKEKPYTQKKDNNDC